MKELTPTMRAGDRVRPTDPAAPSGTRAQGRQEGVYRVTTPYLCAGFVVENGRVTSCAPILRKRLPYWMTLAVKL